MKYLPVLSGIAPPALRREHHTATLVKKALLDTSHLLHARITTAQNLGRQRLRSRRPFSRHAKSLATSNFNLMEQWKHDWQETTKPAQFTIPPGTNMPPGADLPRREWVTLNRLRHWSRSFRCQHVPLGPQPLSSLSVWCSGADAGPHPVRMHQARTTYGISH